MYRYAALRTQKCKRHVWVCSTARPFAYCTLSVFLVCESDVCQIRTRSRRANRCLYVYVQQLLLAYKLRRLEKICWNLRHLTKNFRLCHRRLRRRPLCGRLCLTKRDTLLHLPLHLLQEKRSRPSPPSWLRHSQRSRHPARALDGPCTVLPLGNCPHPRRLRPLHQVDITLYAPFVVAQHAHVPQRFCGDEEGLHLVWSHRVERLVTLPPANVGKASLFRRFVALAQIPRSRPLQRERAGEVVAEVGLDLK
mmetsp:Transcript_26897/g.43081  ORF Transcript_26897/g.43081 Transcript_26897/m.43081 type:complete len:251 (-) Transcript_26897:843-1595(-)